ncbi:hypothetical protein UFOVP68_26 [uncultured Caudovirales phage]|uniref:Uncharacterized protein n=1 Tax=uncultured Caudovirales phage TaxID=2100421 RepID=A0A6J5KUU3_9CAUD|nr:hypothetical protein UFOVP68_26 [uncultured Caudovirales phage]
MSSEIKAMNLPRQQAKLYAALASGTDVLIDDLFRILMDREPPKTAQQHLGPYIVKLNRRLQTHGMVVSPGALKRTYALKKLQVQK